MLNNSKMYLLVIFLLINIGYANASLILNDGKPYNGNKTTIGFDTTSFNTEGYLDYGDYLIQPFRIYNYASNESYFFHATSYHGGCSEYAIGCYLTFAQETYFNGELIGNIAQGFKLLRKDREKFNVTGLDVKSRSTIPLLGYGLGESYLLASTAFDYTREFNETMNEYNITDHSFATPSNLKFRGINLGNDFMEVNQVFFFSSNEFNYKQIFVNNDFHPPITVSEPKSFIILLLGLLVLLTSKVYFGAYKKN